MINAQFDQIQVRENEIKELEQLLEAVPCAVKASTAGLLQCDKLLKRSNRVALIRVTAR